MTSNILIEQRGEEEVALEVLEKLRAKLMARLAELQVEIDALTKVLDIFGERGEAH